MDFITVLVLHEAASSARVHAHTRTHTVSSVWCWVKNTPPTVAA